MLELIKIEEMLKVEILYDVLEKWILENCGGPFYDDVIPEVDVDDILELVGL